MKKARNFIGSIYILFMMSESLWAAALPDFVAPKSMRVNVVSENMVFNGMKMKSAEFKASISADALVAFYRDEWDEEVKESKVADVLILSHYDGKFMFVVQIQVPSGSRQTSPSRGLLSISEPGSLPAQLELGKGFPMPSSSTVINDIKSIDLGKQSRTLYFHNDRSVKSNLKFFQRRFTQDGWVELPQDKQAPVSSGAALIMNKGGDELNMAFSRIQGKTGVVAVIVEK